MPSFSLVIAVSQIVLMYFTYSRLRIFDGLRCHDYFSSLFVGDEILKPLRAFECLYVPLANHHNHNSDEARR
jgi:hypothetical protein